MPVSASHALACSMASGRSPSFSATCVASVADRPATRRCSRPTDSSRENTSISSGSATTDQAGFRDVTITCPEPPGKNSLTSFGLSALSKISSQRS